MITVILSTTADPTRKGLTFKIELEDWAFEAWYVENDLLDKQRREYRFAVHGSLTPRPGNTGVIVIHEDGKVVTMEYTLSWEELRKLLQSADYDFPIEGRGQGRPEKRVLVCTTSKERRTKSLVARVASY